MEGYDREFWQFSDTLRLQTAAFSGLSLGDSIWSPATAADRRNNNNNNDLFAASASPADAAAKNNGGVGLKLNDGGPGLIGSGKLAFGGGKADRYNNLPTTAEKAASVYNSSSINVNGGYAKNNNSALAFNKMGSYGGYNSNGSGNNNSGEVKSYFNKSAGRAASNNSHGHAGGKKGGGAGEYGNKKKHGKNEGNNGGGAGATDKRFKTLPASEALPRGQAIGGYIFVCNNDTMDENLRRELFGESLTDDCRHKN
jgi:hypothetical protein